jgi:protein gp37/ParB-like chromosome segregation protein Spo0J
MTSFAPYKVHPAAAELPLLSDERQAELVASIKQRGLRDPIVLAPDGKQIVDGRNRYLACKLADVNPIFRTLPKATTELEIVEYVQDHGLQRRDLEAGQRTVIHLALNERRENLLTAEAKERARQGNAEGGKTKAGQGRKSAPTSGRKRAGRTDRQVAKDAKVGHGTVSQARKVRALSPQLARDVAEGKISLNEAYKRVRAAEKAAEEKPTAPKPSKSHIILNAYDGDQVQYKLPKGAPTFNLTNEQVSWAKWTWNPVTGCLHTCQFKYCYAKSIASAPKFKDAYPAGFKPLFHHERLDAPAHTKIPANADPNDSRWQRVFVCSMADLYGKWVPDEWIEKVHASCIANPQWEYLMLTKFPQRYVGLQLPPTAWLGTTVDEQKRVKIAEDAFRNIAGVRVKWLSLEPLLEPLEFTDLSMFDWVVIGAQSATDLPEVGHVKESAPEFDWVVRLTLQAREAGCKIYHKPNLLGRPDAQYAGMKMLRQEPNLLPLPRAQGELFKQEAAE